MTPTSKPSSAGLRFLARLKNAIDKDEGTGMASYGRNWVTRLVKRRVDRRSR